MGYKTDFENWSLSLYSQTLFLVSMKHISIYFRYELKYNYKIVQ